VRTFEMTQQCAAQFGVSDRYEPLPTSPEWTRIMLIAGA
jgi:hypothetical protein